LSAEFRIITTSFWSMCCNVILAHHSGHELLSKIVCHMPNLIPNNTISFRGSIFSKSDQRVILILFILQLEGWNFLFVLQKTFHLMYRFNCRKEEKRAPPKKKKREDPHEIKVREV